MVDENKPLDRASVGKALLNYYDGVFSNIKGIFRRFNKNSKDRKGQVSVPPQYHRLSVSSFSSHVSHGSVFTSNGSDSTSNAETLSKQRYRAALKNAINTLKLSQSMVEFDPTIT